jgi:hypothetical protein
MKISLEIFGKKTECQIAGYCMPSLSEFRSGKPAFYPDQSVYAEYACAEFGLSFHDIDGGSGLLFRVASKQSSVHFGAAIHGVRKQCHRSTLVGQIFYQRILEMALATSAANISSCMNGRATAPGPRA